MASGECNLVITVNILLKSLIRVWMMIGNVLDCSCSCDFKCVVLHFNAILKSCGVQLYVSLLTMKENTRACSSSVYFMNMLDLMMRKREHQGLFLT